MERRWNGKVENEPGNNNDDKQPEGCGFGCCVVFGQQMRETIWPLKLKFLWMLVTGLWAGVFGGLIGAQGIPLILFFLVFEYPKQAFARLCLCVCAFMCAF